MIEDSMANIFKKHEVSDKLFEKFSKLLYDKTGINLHYGKKQLLQSRLSKVLRERNLESFEEYYDIVMQDKSNQELVKLIDIISTNVTYFFREEKHFEFMKNVWIDEVGLTGDTLNIWSSACSTGEEPYSIAIQLFELLGKSRKFNILASDISTRVLKTAQRGVYSIDKIDSLSVPMKKKYFLKGKGDSAGFVKVKKDLIDPIEYRRINLIENNAFQKKFDIIFCRNVMIYFDSQTKNSIVKKFETHLKDGGYLFIGHSESLNGLDHNLKYIAPAIYRKT